MHYFIAFLFVFLSVISLRAQDAVAPVATPAAVADKEATPSSESAVPATENKSLSESTPTPTPAATGEDIIPLPSEAGAAQAPIVSESEITPQPLDDKSVPDAAFTDPNAVIPEETSADLPPPPSAGPSAEEIERKLKVRYQEVRTQVDKDPAVRSLLEQAQSEKTFEDQRAGYREYYRLLFKKMKKVDKELTARCDRMEKAYLARLAQTRVEPTIPLKPPPTPEPLAN